MQLTSNFVYLIVLTNQIQMKKLLLFTLLSAFTLSTFAQRNAKAEYWNTFHYKAKEGMEQKFLKAAGIKTKKFNSDPTNLIVTYRITTGDKAGVYERIMPFQTSKSFDRDASKELKYLLEPCVSHEFESGRFRSETGLSQLDLACLKNIRFFILGC